MQLRAPRASSVGFASLFAVSLSVPVSCGGDEFGTRAGDGSAGAPGAGGGAGAGAGGLPAGPACPGTEPTEGAACADGLACSFGDSVRPSCRARWECLRGKWSLVAAATCSRDSTCPLSPPSAGAECFSLGQLCDYPADGALCGCPPCPTFCPAVKWQCAKPPSGKCPRALPNEGEACAAGQLACTYGSCALGDVMTATCTGGRWRWSPALCPT